MFKRKKKKTGCGTPEFRSKVPMPPVKPARLNPNLGWQPTDPTNTNPPNVGSSVQPKQQPCCYITPCGWCAKWDKKCNKKIGSDIENKSQIELKTSLGMPDDAYGLELTKYE